MPLRNGSSKESIAYNIAELKHANADKSPEKKRDIKQILAIAFAKAHKGGK